MRSPKTGPKTEDQSESMPTHTGPRLWDGPLQLHNGLVIFTLSRGAESLRMLL